MALFREAREEPGRFRDRGQDRRPGDRCRIRNSCSGSSARRAGAAPGAVTRLSDLELASRLSFFLWSSSPDDTLLSLAADKKLQRAGRARAAGAPDAGRPARRGAREKLRVAVAAPAQPARLAPGSVRVPGQRPNLMASMERETELFFMSIVREDRPILDLLTADYTFIDGRLARHYKIPNVVGNRFRRVAVDRRAPPRPARPRQHPDRDVVSDPDVAGRARQVDSRQSARRAAAAAAARSAGAQGKHRGREAAAAARAAAGASREPDLRRLPRDDGSDRLRARELRRGRRRRGCSTAASRSIRRASWSTAPSSTARSGCERCSWATSDLFSSTFTEKLLTYALGRGVEYHDMPVVRSIVRSAGQDDSRFSAFVLGIVNSVPFQDADRRAGRADDDRRARKRHHAAAAILTLE